MKIDDWSIMKMSTCTFGNVADHISNDKAKTTHLDVQSILLTVFTAAHPAIPFLTKLELACKAKARRTFTMPNHMTTFNKEGIL